MSLVLGPAVLRVARSCWLARAGVRTRVSRVKEAYGTPDTGKFVASPGVRQGLVLVVIRDVM